MHYYMDYGQNPKFDKIPNWTKFRMDEIPNWTKSRMDKIPNWTKSKTNKIQNWTKPRIEPKIGKVKINSVLTAGL